jgi:hypothetical protein
VLLDQALVAGELGVELSDAQQSAARDCHVRTWRLTTQQPGGGSLTRFAVERGHELLVA